MNCFNTCNEKNSNKQNDRHGQAGLPPPPWPSPPLPHCTHIHSLHSPHCLSSPLSPLFSSGLQGRRGLEERRPEGLGRRRKEEGKEGTAWHVPAPPSPLTTSVSYLLYILNSTALFSLSLPLTHLYHAICLPPVCLLPL